MNRETWLNELAALMAPRFAELGHPLPKFRVSIGWPSSGKDAAVTGECWDARVSGDQHFEIFLNPGRDDAVAVACTMAHELIHAAVGLKEGHKGDFAKVALALGFQRPLTHAQEPEKLVAWVQPMIVQLGPLPHAAITYSRFGAPAIRVKRTGSGISLDEPSEKPEPINNRPPKAGTRLLKAFCQHEDGGKACGYTVRVTRKWVNQLGAPCCPVHGAMHVEGGEDAEG